MTLPERNSPSIPSEPLFSHEDEARWDAMYEATIKHQRAMGEAARAVYEAGQTFEMGFDDEYPDLGKDADSL